MARGGNQAEESILEALGEEPDGDLLAGILTIDATEALGIADTLDAEDVGAEAPAVEEVESLRRHQRALCLGGVGVGIGEEVRKKDDQVEADHHHSADHGHAMLAEAPPHELPLRGHVDSLLLRGGGDRPRHGRAGGIECEAGIGHQVSSMRMRGSISTRRMSEASVPITVMTPSMSTMVPARNMSWAMRAFRRSGPTVGSPRTRDTMMLPDTMYGRV